MTSLPKIKLDKRTLKQYSDFINQQVIPDPPDELIKIYEIRVLTELSYLRAELYDSPENQEALKKHQEQEYQKALEAGADSKELHSKKTKIPRNIQNPNYDRMVAFYKQIITSNRPELALPHIKSLKDMLCQELKVIPEFAYHPAIYRTPIDVRCCSNLSNVFTYFLTEIYYRQLGSESEIFKKFYKNVFDESSLNDAIEYLHTQALNQDQEEYQSMVQQILSGCGHQEAQSYEIDDSYEIDPKKNLGAIKDAVDLFNYIWALY